MSLAPAEPALELSALESLIAPLGAKQFLSDHWERRPLFQQGRSPDRFADLLTPRNIDDLFTTHCLRPIDLRVVRAGDVIPIENYTREHDGTREVRADHVLSLHGDGATIILQQIDRWWAPLRRMAADLEDNLGARAQTNIYITPAGAQGFGAHYDTHDVFILQLSGRKRWRVYDSPIALPLRSQPHQTDPTALPEPTAESVLEPGDIAYIPRGWVHEAMTGAEPSVHVTLGIFPLLWCELIRQVLDCAAEADATLRAGLPIEKDIDERQLAAYARHLALLSDPTLVRKAAERLRCRDVTTRPKDLVGQFLSLHRPEEIELTTKLRHADGLDAALSRNAGEIVLSFGSKTLTLPAAFEPELQFVLAKPRLAARDLPDTMDAGSKLVLVRRLLRERVLVLDTEDTV